METRTDDLPLVVSYGMGVDSTAMLVGLVERQRRPELILFADLGDEKPATYAYLDIMQAYLREHHFPKITVVRYKPKRFKHEPYSTLFGNCWANRTLPSLAFGRKSCSNKWKIAPMDKYVKRFYEARFAEGKQVTRAIGYDAGPKDSCRGGNITDDKRFRYWYPLRDWGWDRDRCKEEIAKAGLPVPCKSACFFCPSTQKAELCALAKEQPMLAALSIAMEDRARPNFKKIDGLWRTGCKGTRKPEARKPGSWRKYLEEMGLMEDLPEVDCDTIRDRM
jgi:hypothetical protein